MAEFLRIFGALIMIGGTALGGWLGHEAVRPISRLAHIPDPIAQAVGGMILVAVLIVVGSAFSGAILLALASIIDRLDRLPRPAPTSGSIPATARPRLSRE